MNKITIIYCCFLVLLLASCREKNPQGALALDFTFSVDEDLLIPHEMKYTNAAGNQYQVDEIKFFISDVELFKANGEAISIMSNDNIHYVDIDIPSTLSWEIGDKLPEGNYDKLCFTFGLSVSKNISHRFPNPPENNMAWPAFLGGGYHYLQINGKWQDQAIERPFNFHTGIGQIYAVDTIVSFCHNYFEVEVPNSKFAITQDQTTRLSLNMNINHWFDNPVFNFENWSTMMQSQEAQNMAKINGDNVFTILP